MLFLAVLSWNIHPEPNTEIYNEIQGLILAQKKGLCFDRLLQYKGQTGKVENTGRWKHLLCVALWNSLQKPTPFQVICCSMKHVRTNVSLNKYNVCCLKHTHWSKVSDVWDHAASFFYTEQIHIKLHSFWKLYVSFDLTCFAVWLHYSECQQQSSIKNSTNKFKVLSLWSIKNKLVGTCLGADFTQDITSEPTSNLTFISVRWQCYGLFGQVNHFVRNLKTRQCPTQTVNFT